VLRRKEKEKEEMKAGRVGFYRTPEQGLHRSFEQDSHLAARERVYLPRSAALAQLLLLLARELVARELWSGDWWIDKCHHDRPLRRTHAHWNNDW
jgi:hypothetical protein